MRLFCSHFLPDQRTHDEFAFHKAEKHLDVRISTQTRPAAEWIVKTQSCSSNEGGREVDFPGDHKRGERRIRKKKIIIINDILFPLRKPGFRLMMMWGQQCQHRSPAPFMASLSFWTSASGLKLAASVTVPRFPTYTLTTQQHTFQRRKHWGKKLSWGKSMREKLLMFFPSWGKNFRLRLYLRKIWICLTCTNTSWLTAAMIGSRVMFPKLGIQKAVKKEEDINNETFISRQKENRAGNCSGSTLCLEGDPLLTFN